MRLVKIAIIIAAALFSANASASVQRATVPAPITRDRLVVTPRPDVAPVESETTDFVLNAQSAWANTGVVVAAGDQLQIVAQGQWSAIAISPNVTNVAPPPYTGPDGYTGRGGVDGLPLLNANRGALIGRIGPNGAPFLIGSAYRGVADAQGPLQVSMNEPGQGFGDNLGRLALRITRTPAAPPTPVPEETIPEPEVPLEPEGQVEDPSAPEQPAIDEAPAPSVDDNGSGAIPPLVIAGVAIGGLFALWLIGSALFGANPRARARRAADQQEPPPGAIAARVITNGEAQETLTITVRGAA
jgi:hypothetical protein